MRSAELDSFYCGPADWATVDPDMGFGCWLAKAFHPKMDSQHFVDYGDAEAAIKKIPGYVKPGADAAVNDLYIPSVRVEDGIPRVQVYAFRHVPTTAELVRDWRYLMLAADVVPSGTAFILELYHPAGIVYGDVGRSTWNTFEDVRRWLKTSQRQENPTAACGRCRRRDDCGARAALINKPDTEFADIRDKKLLAQRLLNEFAEARAKEKYHGDHRKSVMRRLRALSEDNQVNVNDLFRLDVTASTVDRWPYETTAAVLRDAGLWRPEFGRIDVTKLKAAMPGFPTTVQTVLNRLKFTETREAEVRGTLEAATHNIKAPYMRGLVGHY